MHIAYYALHAGIAFDTCPCRNVPEDLKLGCSSSSPKTQGLEAGSLRPPACCMPCPAWSYGSFKKWETSKETPIYFCKDSERRPFIKQNIGLSWKVWLAVLYTSAAEGCGKPSTRLQRCGFASSLGPTRFLRKRQNGWAMHEAA